MLTQPRPQTVFPATCYRRTPEMRTRAVRPAELDLFVEAAGLPDHRQEIERYLDLMFAAGSMRRE